MSLFSFCFISCICFSQSQTDSLAGFNENYEINHIISHGIDSNNIVRYLELAKRRYIDRKYRLGAYSPPKQLKVDSEIDCDNDNWGFEDGTLSGWNQQGAVEVVNNGIDPYGGFPWVYQNGGNYSAKISSDLNSFTNGRLEKTLNIPESGEVLMSFHFAMSIFSYPHLANEAAKLWLEFYDESGNLLSCPYYECYYSTDNGAVGVDNFQETSEVASYYNPNADGDGPSLYTVTYADWNTVTLDLSSYQGQQITIVFRVEWCIYGPDWAYVLLDVDCPEFNSEPETICMSETSVDSICGPDNMSVYTWIDPLGLTVSNEQCIEANIAGNYVLEVIPDDVECNTSSSITFEYTLVPPINISYSTSDYNGYNISCGGGNDGTIDLSVTGGNGSFNYLWNNGLVTEDLTSLSAGTYEVDITSSGNCTTSEEFVLSEPTSLSLNSNLIYDTCYTNGGTAELIVNGGVEPYTFLWSDNQTSPNIYNLSGGSYSVTVSDENNCQIYEQFNIDPGLFTSPKADFKVEPDLEIYNLNGQLENPLTFIDNSSDEINTIIKWFWEFEDGYSSTNRNVFYSFSEIGDYLLSLTVENNYGCTDSISKRIIIEDFILFIPNSFTPQGDKFNDIFLPIGSGIKNYELKIYNRWGDHIFTSNDLKQGWDGTTIEKNNIVQTGVYVYLIKLTDVFGKSRKYTGQVLLVK